MAFTVKKQLSLKFLGEGWEAAYINFSMPSFKQTLELGDIDENEAKDDSKNFNLKMMKIVKRHFINGKGFDDKLGLIDLKNEDMENLPTEAYVESLKFLNGVTDPNS